MQHDHDNTIPASAAAITRTEMAKPTDPEFTVDAPSEDDISVVPFKRGPMTDINFGF